MEGAMNPINIILTASQPAVYQSLGYFTVIKEFAQWSRHASATRLFAINSVEGLVCKEGKRNTEN
jgi:hypothetical protein